MYSKYSHRHQGSEFVSFALIVLLIGGLMLIQFLLSVGISARDLEEMYRMVRVFSSIFPEAKQIFEKAYLMAYQAHVLQQELSKEYSNKVLILLAWAKGEVSFPVSHLLYGAISRYIFGYGVIYGLAVKSAWLMLSAPLIIAGVVLWRNKKLLRLITAYIKSKWMDPFGDRRIQIVLRVLLVNPVPASIFHHSPEPGGLLKHSYAVAKNAANRAAEEGLDAKEAFLAGLVHDIGKTRLYRYECYEETQADKELKPTNKSRTIKKCGWVSLGTSQDVLNRIVMKELKDRFNITFPPDRRIWEIVKKADVEETLKELQNTDYDISSVFIKALMELNVNNVFNTGKYDGWYSPKTDFVVVLAHALNREVTAKLLEQDPGLPLSTEPGISGVHTIAYANPYKDFILTEIEGKKADKLGLFDAKVGKHIFNAVYLIRKEVIPSDLLAKWGETEYAIEVMERKG